MLTKGSGKADPLADLDIDDMTVEQIADEIGKTVRGVKTMLTRRGLVYSPLLIIIQTVQLMKMVESRSRLNQS